MIYFKIGIINIFKRSDTYECISPKNWYHRLPFERSIEIDYGRIDNTLLTIGLSTRFTGRDHAGPEIELSIFGYGVCISFPKSRHWNSKKNCWLENYKVWMDSVEDLFDTNSRLKKYDFRVQDFREFYESGFSPEEAINKIIKEIAIWMRSTEALFKNNSELQSVDFNLEEEFFIECYEAGASPEEAIYNFIDEIHQDDLTCNE